MSRYCAMKPSREVMGIALGLAAALIWGGYLAMARSGIGAGLQATDIAALRYGIGGLIMLPWLIRHQPRQLGGIGWRRASVLALLAGPAFVLVGVSAYRFAPLAHGAVVQPAVLTLGAMGGAILFFGDKLGWGRAIGLATIIAGLLVIAGPGLLGGGSLTLLGDGLFAIAGLMWAGFTLLCKQWQVRPVVATAAISVLSAVIYTPVYLGLVGMDRLLAAPFSVLVPQALVQGVLAGVVAVMAYSRAVELLGPGRAALFPAMVPVSAIILGVPIVGEWPNLAQLIGLGVVTLGLLIALGVVPGRTKAANVGLVRAPI